MKKMKLLMSLSMLCLSIAMLCFGVFAASSVTYTISGTISYTVTDVYCTISGVVYRNSAANVATATLNTNLTSLIGGTTSGYTSAQTLSAWTSTGSATSPETKAETVNIAFGKDSNSAEWYTYYIILTIQNNSSKQLSANLAITHPASGDTGYSLLNISTGSKTATIAANATQKVGIAYSLNDKKTSISNLALSNVLTVS